MTQSATIEAANVLRGAISEQLGPAMVCTRDDTITASTGKIKRVWKWTGKGIVTVSIQDEATGREWAVPPGCACDWDLPNSVDIATGTDAAWVGAEARVSDDDGFTGRHIELVSTFRYEQECLEVRHVVWIFPDAPGLRTQLWVKALPGFDANGLPETEGTYRDCGATFLKASARSEYLPLDFAVPNERLYWGYYNNAGNRHDQSQDMLKEQVVKGWPIFLREDIDWASGVAVKYGDNGVILVKESPKCVNQQAHNTGAFYGRPWGLASTGWGLTPKEILPDRFRECWANWTIVYQGGDDGLQCALKQFDGARYPVFPERDMFILSNTWGPANPMGAQFTQVEYVLKEIPALAEIGVEVMQIDDGWQKSGGLWDAKDFLPKYKNGWGDIKTETDNHGLRLGLWVAIRNAKVEELEHNLDELGFISWKADFEHLADRGDYEERCARYREVMKHAWMKTQFTLCPEYDDPRYGWYYAREYGSIFFQNIQEALPDHLTMVPFQVLRQHWLMAKYFPANKLQVMLQNPKRTNRERSDAWQHSHGYCFALGLPFVPCFFQSGQYLDPEGREEVKALINIYKDHRKGMFTSYTYPVGEIPDNASWSGFQMIKPDGTGGYLLIFRELHNDQAQREIGLKFLNGRRIELENLQTGTRSVAAVSEMGRIGLEIDKPASYSFHKYDIL